MTSNPQSSLAAHPPTMPAIHHPDDNGLSNSMTLISSVHSLSSSRQQASQVAKTYRQAANLFLTRRLPEALSTIEPLLTPQPPESEDTTTNGTSESHLLAPIALASRTSRIRVWSFYLTFLNAVVNLGPEEGKYSFGTAKWKSLVSKARDGTVWEDIIRDGYGGMEGNVDADVVVNLYVLCSAGQGRQLSNMMTGQLCYSPTRHRSSSTNNDWKPICRQ
jgi:hypothetical protein